MVTLSMFGLNKPIVAAINGAAGIGATLCLAADCALLPRMPDLASYLPGAAASWKAVRHGSYRASRGSSKHCAGRCRDATRDHFAGDTLSYAALQGRIEKRAACFAKRGARKDDRVVYLALNHSDFLGSLFACARIGAIFMPVNYRLSAGEVAELLNYCGAAILAADPGCAQVIDKSGIGSDLSGT